ncbi:MAG: hypothetical protein ABI923_10890 [bacterium]
MSIATAAMTTPTPSKGTITINQIHFAGLPTDIEEPKRILICVGLARTASGTESELLQYGQRAVRFIPTTSLS